MTVISTLVGRDCIVHASDSPITERRWDGTAHPLDWKATKFARVPRARGILAYYGFAGWSGEVPDYGHVRCGRLLLSV